MPDRYLYQVGYSTCDESNYVQLWHECELSDSDLEQMVARCVADAAEELEKERSREIKEYPELAEFQSELTFQDIMPRSEPFMKGMRALGFSRAEFAAQCSVFGWAKYNEPGDWATYSDGTTQRMQEKCKNRPA